MTLEVRPAGISLPLSSYVLGRLRALLTCSVAFLVIPATAEAQQPPGPPLTRNLLGSVGLIDMPSARMAEDGTLSLGASYLKNIQHYNLGFQVLPWLEASFRYSGLSQFDASYPVYWDRSFGMKIRLATEGSWMPAIALGINDLVGTGIYSGEYLVASKQFGNFDATFGVGWGRYGSNNTVRNPLGLLSDSFYNRRPDTNSPGSTPFSSFFHDPTAGLFGGINWHTPIDGLTLSVETSSDAYRAERVGTLVPNSRWNYGMTYRLGNTILSASYLYGETFAGAISFELDPSRPQYPGTLGVQVPPPVIRSTDAQHNALQKLIGQRDPKYRAYNAHAKNRNGFVDTVFGMRSVADVQVRGGTLAITLSNRENLQAFCRAIAREAGYSAADITQVSVRSPIPTATESCGVPRALQLTASQADIAPSTEQLRAGQLTMIDAADVQPVADPRAAEKKFRADAQKQSIKIDAAQFTESEAIVYYENNRYLHEDDALERLSRLLMADAPSSIEQFRFVAVKNGIPQQEFHVLRGPAERVMSSRQENPSVFDSPVSIEPPPLENPILEAQQRSQYPSFDWFLFPQLRQQLFDPNNPVGLQLVGVLAGIVDLKPGLQISGAGELNLLQSFRTDRPPSSDLPHVRTDFAQYFTKGKNGIGWLTVNYRTKLAPEVYATAKFGYLESMFAGVGGEMLYRPNGARWAIGADLYEVWQRDYDRLFGLQNYHVTTGHVTLYWDSPFYDLNFQLRAGQYLAGDRGLTLQITRRFSTGIEIGAFATKTNVSAAQFGEGSFDKGIIIRIPLGWVAPVNTQNQIPLILRPVQRDGGQVLQVDATLYEETRITSQSEFVRGGHTFADDN